MSAPHVHVHVTMHSMSYTTHPSIFMVPYLLIDLCPFLLFLRTSHHRDVPALPRTSHESYPHLALFCPGFTLYSRTLPGTSTKHTRGLQRDAASVHAFLFGATTPMVTRHARAITAAMKKCQLLSSKSRGLATRAGTLPQRVSSLAPSSGGHITSLQLVLLSRRIGVRSYGIPSLRRRR